MPIDTKIEIEADGTVDFTVVVKTIVDWVLTHNGRNQEEGLQRINIRRTVGEIWSIMKQELPTNPMTDLDFEDSHAKEICRITLKNILINYGVSESHLRRVMPRTLKLINRTNLRYRGSLPYFDSGHGNVMIPARTKRTENE